MISAFRGVIMTSNPTKAPASVLRDEAVLAKHALSYPEVNEEAPWPGHRAFKVRGKKVFLFLGSDGDGLGLSTKLPMSSTVALGFPFAEPTGYGLGKSGWVSAQFKPSDKVPLDLLREWIDESYRAIAPKKLVAQLSEPAAKTKPAAKRRMPNKKAPRKSTAKRKAK
jgi:predicted DNA-binding protein (MmcQ/YjbR family)